MSPIIGKAFSILLLKSAGCIMDIKLYEKNVTNYLFFVILQVHFSKYRDIINLYVRSFTRLGHIFLGFCCRCTRLWLRSTNQSTDALKYLPCPCNDGV